MSGASSSDRNVGEKLAADLGHVTTVDAGTVPTPVAQADSAVSFAVIADADGALAIGRGASDDGDAHARGPLKPGDSLGRFVIRAELGRGGMGVVYAADDAKLGREVALKVLPISEDEDSRRRFFREARSAAGLTDPGIATIYDVGEDAGRMFIAMELVRGKTLRALLDARPSKDRALPVADALRVGREVARALAAAHARRVTHRDLKPENVMITDAGHVKILDFGLAKSADPSLDTGSIGTASTDAGRILGTPSYMSPEQAKGRPVDVRSDVFSFGVMLYELTTGARPFDRPTIVEMFVAIDRDEPAPPSRATPSLPASFERVVLRCLRKDPALRYADAREVLADLEPLTTAPQSPRFSRAAIAAAVAVVAAGVVAFAATRAPTTQVAITRVESAKAAPAIVAVPLMALPFPEQGKPEAIAAYRDALLAYRDGDDWDSGFERALELDPSLTIAHLRLAALSMAMAMPTSREHFRKADEQRGALSDRDRGLLDAIEPVVRRQPSDWAESNKRFAALTDRYPGDAELWFLLACGTANYADFEAGVRYFEKAAALDPAFARAYAGAAMDQAYLGRFDAARGAITRCLAASPVSHSCLSNLLLFQALAGECEGLEATARRMIAAGAPKWNAYTQLALALAARGQPISTVREALRQAEAAIDPTKTKIRERAAVGNALRVGLLSGDFEAAEKSARTYEKLVAESREQDEHGLVALELAEILGEQGRDKEAGEVAIDFLDRRDAWEPNPGAEDVAMSRDATPSLLVAALVGGRLTRADYVARRAASLKSWSTRVTPVSRNFVWLHAWARPAFDAESAREAVAALPDYPPPPPFRPETAVDHDVGRTFLLAGRADDAVAWLGPYTKSCTVFDNPIEHTRAFLLLGRAREAKGDTLGACAAYQVVLDRWGKAKPKSVTADAAQARVKALRCGG